MDRLRRAPGWIGICLISVWIPQAGSELEPIVLRVATELAGGQLSVVPYVEAAASANLRYEVISRKEGPSGTSITRQAGNLQVSCCAPVAASKLTLSTGPEDRYTVTVKLFADGKVVVEQTIRHP